MRTSILLHIYLDVRLATVVAGSSAVTAGHDIHAGSVCSSGPDCEHCEIEPDTNAGVCILGNLLSDSVLHLSPIDGQMEAIIDALVSCQECELSLCKAVDEACRHTDIDGLSGTLGRLHQRPMQLRFHNHWDQRKLSLSHLIPLVPNDWLVLNWWSCRSNVMVGQSLRSFTSNLTIFADASLEGWGAHSDAATASGKLPPQWRLFAINWLELEAVRLALVAFQSQVENKHILVMFDNKTAVA